MSALSVLALEHSVVDDEHAIGEDIAMSCLQRKASTKDADERGEEEFSKESSNNTFVEPHQDEKEPEDRSEEHEANTAEEKLSILRFIIFLINVAKEFVSNHKKIIRSFLLVGIVVGTTAYMIAAMVRNFQRALPLFVIWCLVFTYQVYLFISVRYGGKIIQCFKPLFRILDKGRYWIKLVVFASIGIGLMVWVAENTSKQSNQVISFVGYFVFLFCLFITSKHPDKIILRPIVMGLLLQVFCAMIILRTEAGFNAFKWLGELTKTFIYYVDDAIKYLFGEGFGDHNFAFKVLPIIVFFCSFMSLMYYFGVMQWLILKIAWLMQFTLNTSATETLVAAGNIFVGQTEAPLLILPYIGELTMSEYHAVLVSGLGSIAFTVVGPFIDFGIEPIYIISSCVMAAPCSLAVSKLAYPETQKSKFATSKNLTLEKSKETSIIEAVYVGASQAVPLALNIAGNLIAFLSLLAAVNGFLGWFGGLLDFPGLSFKILSSYAFLPVAFLMGIDWDDCFKAAELLGTKIFLNEFIAYNELGSIIKSRDFGTLPHVDPITGEVNWIDERSEAIITYALCGFANFGSLGILLGGLGTMAPKKQSEIIRVLMRSLLGGIFVSLLNACVAGLLYIPRPIACDKLLSNNNWTYAKSSRLFTCCSMKVASASPNETIKQWCCDYIWNTTSLYLDC